MPEQCRAVRAALSAVAGCTAAAILYAVLRMAQAFAFGEPDPALVLFSEHSGYFWRAWTGAYAGGMVGLVTWLASANDTDRTATILARAVPAAAALLATQGLLVP